MNIASLALSSCVVLTTITTPLAAQTLDIALPPGENFDKADFRLWHPEQLDILRGVLVLVPGSWLPTEALARAWRELVGGAN